MVSVTVAVVSLTAVTVVVHVVVVMSTVGGRELGSNALAQLALPAEGSA